MRHLGAGLQEHLQLLLQDASKFCLVLTTKCHLL